MESVILRRFRFRDTFQMKRWGEYDDDRFIHYNFPYRTLVDLFLWYRMKTSGGNRRLFGAFNREGTLVGYVVLKNIDWQTKEGEMGISFDYNQIDKGYGTDAVRAFVRLCFTQLGMKRIWLKTSFFNKRAVRCYEKAGFRHVKLVHEPFEEQVLAFRILMNYEGFNMNEGLLYADYHYMEITNQQWLEQQEERRNQI